MSETAFIGQGLDTSSHGVAPASALERGSTSFAAAARLLGPRARESAALLYAWCRYCDDVVDGQVLGGLQRASSIPAQARVEGIRAGTLAALAGRARPGTVFAGLQTVVARHVIPACFPMDLIDGFGMDADGRRYETLGDTVAYAYRVAGSVGVMMAHVLGVRDLPTLRRACDLGIGFQLSNIARDVVEDAKADRVYLPGAWLRDAGIPSGEVADPRHRDALATVVTRLLDEAEPYYASAREGIGRLPLRAACAIGAARAIYHEIGVIVRASGARAWETRATTCRARKLVLAAQGCAVAVAARVPTAVRRSLPREGLFTPIALREA